MGPAEQHQLRLLRFAQGHLEVEAGRRAPLRTRLDFGSIRARPFLKWPGGKQWLAPIAMGLLPDGFEGRYFEPFLGGGALFFALQPTRATLSDVNLELVTAYRALRSDVASVVGELATYPYDRAFFERLRGQRPTTPSAAGARLIYLNKTAFNGMYRVNRAGEFNVPFGRYKRPTICQEDRLRRAAKALRGAKLGCVDFAAAAAAARRGDLVYLDPPYITGHHNNGFRKYNADIFRWDCQERLASVVASLTAKKVSVLMTNADHPAIHELYSDLLLTPVERRSLINSSVTGRGMIREGLYTNYPLSVERIIDAATAGR